MTHLRLTAPGFVIAIVVAMLAGGSVAWLAAPQGAVQELPEIPRRAASTAAAHGTLNAALLYEQRMGGVVTVYSQFSGSSDLVGGSGFVVDAKAGHLLTNAHVVTDTAGQPADAIWLDFPTGDRVQATVRGIDPFSDVAVLEVDPDAVRLQQLPIGNSDDALVGEDVAAIGSPLKYEGSLSVGIVSATDRTISAIISQYDITGAIQTTAAINHGSSGGPLFDASGRVIGINTQIRNTQQGVAQGVAFAVPINTAMRSLRQITSDGRVSYAYLGIKSETVTPQMAQSLGLSEAVTRGAIIQELPSGPAATAGLAKGDVIVSVAARPVHERDDVTAIVNRLSVGDRVEVEYYRAGERHTAVVTLGERPRTPGT